jgi:O-antigen/teichoic acid export membrane protein
VTEGAPRGALARLASGSAWTIATFGISTLAGPVLTVVLVRHMTRTEWGHLAVATSIVALLSVIAGLGLTAAVSQVAASLVATEGEAGAHAALRSGLRVATTAAAGGVVLVLAALGIVDAVGRLRPALGPMLVMAPAVVIAPVTGALVGFLRATHRPRWLAAATAVSSVVSGVLVVVALVARRPSAVVIGTARTIGTVVATGLFALGVVRWVRSRSGAVEVASVSRRLWSFGLAMLLTGVFTAALSELDIVVLAGVRGTHASAFYAPASAVADGIMSLPALIGTFYLPIVTGLAAKDDRERVANSYHVASRWNLVLCAPFLSIAVACPEAALRVLFGGEFAVAATPLRVLALGAVVQVLFGFNGLTLDSFGLPRVVLVRQVVSLGLDVVLCVALVPRFGPTGAAFATAGAIAAANVLCSVSLFRRFEMAPWDRPGLLTSLAVFAGLALAAVATANVSGALTQIVLAAAVGLLPVAGVAFGSASAYERDRIGKRLGWVRG